jgi:CRP-like cAMP-binding protein
LSPPGGVGQLQPAKFTAGQTIFDEGSAGDKVYFVLAGRVKITHPGRRRRPLRATA